MTEVVFGSALARLRHQVHQICLVAQVSLLLVLMRLQVRARVIVATVAPRHQLMSSLGPAIDAESRGSGGASIRCLPVGAHVLGPLLMGKVPVLL